MNSLERRRKDILLEIANQYGDDSDEYNAQVNSWKAYDENKERVTPARVISAKQS